MTSGSGVFLGCQGHQVDSGSVVTKKYRYAKPLPAAALSIGIPSVEWRFLTTYGPRWNRHLLIYHHLGIFDRSRNVLSAFGPHAACPWPLSVVPKKVRITANPKNSRPTRLRHHLTPRERQCRYTVHCWIDPRIKTAFRRVFGILRAAVSASGRERRRSYRVAVKFSGLFHRRILGEVPIVRRSFTPKHFNGGRLDLPSCLRPHRLLSVSKTSRWGAVNRVSFRSGCSPPLLTAGGQVNITQVPGFRLRCERPRKRRFRTIRMIHFELSSSSTSAPSVFHAVFHAEVAASDETDAS
jgi:hypothetical protein